MPKYTYVLETETSDERPDAEERIGAQILARCGYELPTVAVFKATDAMRMVVTSPDEFRDRKIETGESRTGRPSTKLNRQVIECDLLTKIEGEQASDERDAWAPPPLERPGGQVAFSTMAGDDGLMILAAFSSERALYVNGLPVTLPHTIRPDDTFEWIEKEDS